MRPLRLIAAALVLLGLVPVYIYFGGPVTYLALSFACVILIAATLYLAFGPASGDHAHASDAR